MGFKNVIVQGGGGGGNVPAGAAVLTDSFTTLEISAAESNAAQTDVLSVEIDANYSDQNAAQTDEANVGISGFAESSPAPAELLNSSSRRFATTTRSSGTAPVNPANSTGQEDGATATVKAGGVLGGTSRLETVIVPPFDNTEANTQARAFYSVQAGLLDSVSATLFYFVNTQAGQDSPIVFLEQAVNAGTTNAETQVVIPTSVQTGDLLIASASSSGAQVGTLVTPSGWTQFDTFSSANQAMRVYTKLATGTDAGATVDFFGGGVGQKGVAGVTANESAVAVFRGNDKTSAIESSNKSTQAISDGTFTLPTVTTAGTNRAVIYTVIYAGSNPAGGTPTNVRINSPVVERVNHGAAGGSTSISGSAFGSEIVAQASAVSARTVTFANSQAGRTAMLGTLVIKPAIADGNPAIAADDLPRTGNFLANPATVNLANVDISREIFLRIQHNALLPALGGQANVDSLSINTNGVL